MKTKLKVKFLNEFDIKILYDEFYRILLNSIIEIKKKKWYFLK